MISEALPFQWLVNRKIFTLNFHQSLESMLKAACQYLIIININTVLYFVLLTNKAPSSCLVIFNDPSDGKMKSTCDNIQLLLLLLSTPLHQRAASRVQHPNHVAANSLSPLVARKGSTLSGFVQRSRLEREVGRDLHSNKWEEV